jgi:hypothetical protein
MTPTLLNDPERRPRVQVRKKKERLAGRLMRRPPQFQDAPTGQNTIKKSRSWEVA